MFHLFQWPLTDIITDMIDEEETSRVQSGRDKDLIIMYLYIYYIIILFLIKGKMDYDQLQNLNWKDFTLFKVISYTKFKVAKTFAINFICMSDTKAPAECIYFV